MTEQMKSPVPLPLPLQGTGNTRELGGYTGLEGRTTKSHTLLRSDDLSGLTETDQKFLKDYGVTGVIDLRTAEEVERQHSVFLEDDEITYYHVPLSDQLISEDGSWERAERMADLYIRLLEQQGESFAEIFRIILSYRGKTVLFHCAAGKDRTGVTAMLLLLAAGVSCDMVMKDYSVSEKNMKEIFDKQRKALAQEDMILPSFVYTSGEDEMAVTIACLVRKWGGAEGYLKSHGITGGEIEEFQKYFLE